MNPPVSTTPHVTRPALPGDLPALLTIWREFMHAHAARDQTFRLAGDAEARWQQMALDLMSREDSFVLTTTLAEVPRGLCVGWVARNPTIYAVTEIGFIAEICVSQGYFCRGIGGALMHAARQWFSARKLGEFQLATAIWNTDAQAYWSRHGGLPCLVRYRFDLPESA